MNYKEFMNLFVYLMNNNGRSFLYSDDASLVDNIRLFKQNYPHNVYIIDSCDYYSDDVVVKLSDTILHKKKTVMNDYMNTHIAQLPPTHTSHKEIICRNIIFILNIHTFVEANKNLLQFINSLESSTGTHISFVSANSIFSNLRYIYDQEFNIGDFCRTAMDVDDSVSLEHVPCYRFKNYKSLTKYKKHIFPFDKIKVTKKRTEQYLQNVVIIEEIDHQPYCTELDNTLYMDYHDYKKIITHYLLSDTFDYTILFNVSHCENIPMILYENIETIVGKNHKNSQAFKNRIRETCLKYYSYGNDPDMYLFRKTNLYYFMYDFKTTLHALDIELKPTNLKKIKFTKYYSNRASEIQSQNAVQSYLFIK